jgi:hypothetical protein
MHTSDSHTLDKGQSPKIDAMRPNRIQLKGFRVDSAIKRPLYQSVGPFFLDWHFRCSSAAP